MLQKTKKNTKITEELQNIKDNFLKKINYEINIMSEHMPEGSIKNDFIKMMLKIMLK